VGCGLTRLYELWRDCYWYEKRTNNEKDGGGVDGVLVWGTLVGTVSASISVDEKDSEAGSVCAIGVVAFGVFGNLVGSRGGGGACGGAFEVGFGGSG